MKSVVQPFFGLVKRFLAQWRTSLSFRVLTTTLLLAIVVAFGVSSIAVTQVRDGLVEQRTNTAVQQAAEGQALAAQVISSAPFPNSSSDRIALVDAVVSAVAGGSNDASDYQVLLLASAGQSLIDKPERGTGGISDQSVTAALRQTVVSEEAVVWQISELKYIDGSEKPGVVVGVPLNLPGVGEYELYLLLPFEEQIQMLNLTRQAVFVAGIFMVVALVGVALLLTNQVVRPIRSVAASAERLKSGRLTERIAVRGQDDLAVLASSFNSMAASMQEQIRKLESLSRVQQRFVSDVSHELRTPLTTIRMASELLYAAKKDFDPANERAIELLQQQSERFELMLNDLLEISRIDAGSARVEAVQGDFAATVRAVIEDLDAIIFEKQLDLIVHRLGEFDFVIEADFRRVERIVRNLISNAIEHADNKPIDVVLFRDEEVLVFCVRDHGVGLEPGQAALVFNRFWRADPSRQRTLGGTGLGLSISMEDARLHGGWLEADGEIGKGSNFRLVLPTKPNTNFGAVSVPLGIEKFDEWFEANK